MMIHLVHYLCPHALFLPSYNLTGADHTHESRQQLGHRTDKLKIQHFDRLALKWWPLLAALPSHIFIYIYIHV